jgi:aspartate carbamoyltransferase catalytic subunit
VKVVLISPEQLRLPSYMKEEVCDKYGMDYKEVESLEEAMGELDVLYMTRVQQERFDDLEEYERLKDSFILDVDKLKTAQPHMRILHPLPRVNEITVEVDDDPRAAYFRQVENGKFVRMALITKLLEWAKDDSKTRPLLPEGTVRNTMKCSNSKCISNMENVDSLFRPSHNGDSKWRCVYCEAEAK